MARKLKIPAHAPPPSPDEHLPRVRLVWGRLAVTRRDVDLWPLSRRLKERAVEDHQSQPMNFGVRRLRHLDERSQLVIVGVGTTAAPERVQAPRVEGGLYERVTPVVGARLAVSYFSDELTGEETVRGALEELLASPLWRAADARLVGLDDPEHPRVIDHGGDAAAGEDDDAPPADAILDAARWFLVLENSVDEAVLVRGRMVARDGDSYAEGRVTTSRRVDEGGDVTRVIGVPLATVDGAETLVGLRFPATPAENEACWRGLDDELRAALPGSYPIDTWLLAPARG